MFVEIKFQPNDHIAVNAVSGLLATFSRDTWRNNDQNGFISLGLSASSLDIVIESYGKQLAITYSPIDISDQSLSQEERAWMQNLLEKQEYILSLAREFGGKDVPPQ